MLVRMRWRSGCINPCVPRRAKFTRSLLPKTHTQKHILLYRVVDLNPCPLVTLDRMGRSSRWPSTSRAPFLEGQAAGRPKLAEQELQGRRRGAQAVALDEQNRDLADHALNDSRGDDQTKLHRINSNTTHQYPAESFYAICVDYLERWRIADHASNYLRRMTEQGCT